MGEVLGRAVSGTEAVSREQWPERLKNGLDALNIRYDPATPERLARYHQLLTEWNQVMNLTGDTDFETSLGRHYLDSLAPLGIEGLFPESASLIDVIAVRNQLLPAGEREENIACDLNDLSWFDRIDAAGGAVFFAAGVFYYFLNEQVRALFTAMADAFPGGRLVFDAAGKKAVRLMLKTWIKSANIQDVGAYFSVSDAKAELSRWSARLAVSSRGYMLGYHDLKDPSVSGFFRFLARLGDGMMKMQIVRLDFQKEA